MTKTQAIAAQVLAKVAAGVDVIEALRTVCGARNVDQMIESVYVELRQKAVR